MRAMQNTPMVVVVGGGRAAWRLHTHCYHYRDNMQSLWLHYQGTAGMHLFVTASPVQFSLIAFPSHSNCAHSETHK